jgi:hypothetical protein
MMARRPANGIAWTAVATGVRDARAPTAGRLAAIAVVFVAALGVRLLYYTEARAELYGVEQERYRIAQFYHAAAADLAEGNDRVVFPSPADPLDTLAAGYPPGYFAFMAAVYRLAGPDMGAVLLLQCVLDAATAVVVLLLGEALFSTGVGFVAGLLTALSPQLAYLSLVLKPDTLTVLPIAGALLLVVRGARSGRTAHFVAAGICLGVACWLRQNALLLAPGLALGLFVLRGPRETWRGAMAIVAACAALVAPITVRNAVLYGEFVPVTFGAGFALFSGLARDDYAGRYGLPRFAYNVSIREAEARGLPPDFYFDRYEEVQAGESRKFDVKHTVLSVFAVDGIARDRERARQARALIASDPGYFASLVALRAGRLLDYSRQLRPVPLSVGPRARAFETVEFYQRLGSLEAYYAREGIWYDRIRSPLAVLQGLFGTWTLFSAAAVGLLVALFVAWRHALFLLIPPVYYLGLQSLMWAEFRHTLPIHVSVFIFIGVAAGAAAQVAAALVRRAPSRSEA